MPYVNDFVSHVFFYAKHMATVHAENGKWHVHFEAAENTQSDINKESNLPSSSKKENTITEHCLFFNSDEQQHGNTEVHNYWPLKNEATVNTHTEKNYPPPRCYYSC